MTVRPALPTDRDAALAMMAKLWPDENAFNFTPETLFVWENDDQTLGGFSEYSLRPFVDGCDSAPCPHVEGWWVEPELRGQGIGRRLIAAIEDLARARGFTELGSDALLSNRLSLAAHAGIGFEPTEQLQYFRKTL